MKAIKNAPGYSINEKNEIINDKTKKSIKPNNGKVRLMVDGKRKSFKVSELLGTEEKAKGWRKPDSPAAPKKEEVTEPKKKTTVVKKKTTVVKKKSKAKDNTVAKDLEKRSPAELIKMGRYPYKIKDLDKIKAVMETLEKGDKVKFVDYQTKRKITGTVVSHTKFSDNYPGVRVSTGKGKDKKTRILSYLNVTKK